MMIRGLGTAAMVCALLTAGAANATRYTYVVTGTVDADNSYDDENLFNRDLTGATFTATYVLDDSLPTASYSYDAVTSRADGGGLFLAGTTPPLTAMLAINGRTAKVFQGDSRQDPVFDPVTGDASGPTSLERDQGSAYKDAAMHSLELGATFSASYSCCAPVTFYADSKANGLSFSLSSQGFTDPDFRQLGTFALDSTSAGFFYDNYSTTTRQGSTFDFTNVQLVAQTLTVTSDAVPEPASWALMVAGFGAAGGLVRRRRARPAYAA